MTTKPWIAFVAVVLLVGAAAQPLTGQTRVGRFGNGHELLEDCQRYFSFLGRTGAGREETYDENPFGMGYCAGLLRGVARSVETFHPTIECRLSGYVVHHVVRSVVRYLESHPRQLDEPDTELVLRALQFDGICAEVVR